MDTSRNNSDDRGTTAVIHANDSLASENRNRGIPAANLGFSSSHDTPDLASNTSVARAVSDRNHETLAVVANESLTLHDETFSYIHGVDGGTTIVPLHPNEAQNKKGGIVLDLLYDSRADFELDHQLGLSLIDPFINWRRVMRGISEDTLTTNVSRLRRLLTSPLVYDHKLQMWRPFTVREYLAPDYGRSIALCLMMILTEDLGLGQVALDLLQTLRVFLRSICQGGTILEDSTNVRKLWGVLSCPLNDSDIKKRKVKSQVFLPRLDEMPRIFDASLDWAAGRKRRAIGYRTATEFIAACDAGWRGVEECGLLLSNQSFDRSVGPHTIENPLALYNAKVGGARAATVEPNGFEVLRWYLQAVRPKLTVDQESWVFPSERGAQLSSASFSSTTSELIDHLKGLHLLHEEFTFHSTRKVYATHFMERDGNIEKLLLQCGWSNSGQLAVYLRASFKAIQKQEAVFARGLDLAPVRGL